MISFEEFSKQFLKERSQGYYQKFWAGTAMANGLTVKTPDGKEFMVKPEKIYMVDLGEMSGNCMCGHAIRYEYYLDQIGPIGSKCIQTMTGLQGEDLRKILRGAEFARKDRDDLLRVKNEYGTFENQLIGDSYLKQVYDVLSYDEMTPEIKHFIDNNIPMPHPIKYAMRQLVYNKEVKVVASKKYGSKVEQPLKEYEAIYATVDQIIKNCDLVDEYQLYGNDKYCFEVLKDIGDKVKEGKASEKQVDLFIKLWTNLKNEKFNDALYVLIKLSHFPDQMEEFWGQLVKENLTKALKWGLSDGQCEFILNKSSKGKDGLATRFKDLLEKDVTDKEDQNTPEEGRLTDPKDKIDFIDWKPIEIPKAELELEPLESPDIDDPQENEDSNEGNPFS